MYGRSALSAGRGSEQLPRSLRFFYFGNQCPHNGYLLARVKTIAWRESVVLHLHDISRDDKTCAEYRVFSPQMLVVNDKYRHHGPFSAELVLALLQDEASGPVVDGLRQSDDIVRGDLVRLTPQAALATCDTCAGSPDPGLCRGKSEWVTDILKESGLTHLGYIHLVGGKCVGGAEFLPSSLVPYPIPDKGARRAFLTCVYVSDEARDYKTHPLEKLLQDLGDMGFDAVSVAASTASTVPNGPVSWFERFGFEDRGLLVREEMHAADIHLLSMRL